MDIKSNITKYDNILNDDNDYGIIHLKDNKQDIKVLILLYPDIVGIDFYYYKLKEYNKKNNDNVKKDDKNIKDNNKKEDDNKKENDDEIKPNGYLYNVYLLVKEKYRYKYNFIEEFAEPKILNFDNLVIDVENNKYNMVIGSFYKNSWREEKANYTHPLFYSANSIIHINKKNKYDKYVKIFYEILKPIILLLLLGIIFGIIIHIVEPDRSSYLYSVKRHKKKLKYKGEFKRTLLTTIAAFFGEMGFLSENSTLTISSIVLVVLTMVIGYIIISITEARLTYITIESEKYDSEINIDRLHKYKLIGLKGNAESQKLESNGAIIHYVENLTPQELIQYYLKNKDKYDGFIMVYTEINPFLEDNEYNLEAIYQGLGLNACCWVIDKNNNKLLDDINITLLELRANKKSYNICKEFIKLNNACFS